MEPTARTDLYADLAQLSAEGRAFVVATVVQTGGSTPQKPGTKLVVLEDGSIRGTVGGGAIERQVMEAARALFASTDTSRLLETHLTHELGMCCGGKMSVFLEKHWPAQLFVFGAGHVCTELAHLAHRVGFRVTVVDERAEWADPSRFPEGVQVVRKDPVDFARTLQGGAHHYFCIATYDHPLDQSVIEALLRTPAAYHGVIGSRRKAERFKQRLEAGGFDDGERARMRSPMGLDIHAITPAEIAVSIVAELVAIRRGLAEPGK